ncbi:MAG: TY-Chap domain-containing protein [Xanthobacteraceae bacterium]
MLGSRMMLTISLVLTCVAASPVRQAQAQGDSQSCTGSLTDQLRRLSEKCLSDLIRYVASQPAIEARISSEKDKYYIVLVKDAKGFRAEAVSKLKNPMVTDETMDTLKRLGWAPPENEGDNWKKPIDAVGANSGAAAEDVAKALEAYGVRKGDAISLTVGTISK